MVSVILQCDLEENVRRLTDASRGVHDKKLTDVEILKRIHAEEDIYHFEGELELEINVTKKSPGTVAGEIRDFLDHTR